MIRIANPKGNRAKPKGRSDASILKKLKDMVKDQQRQEFDEMFSLKIRAEKRKNQESRACLKGLVNRSTMLFRTYKGKDYKATLSPKGYIKSNRKKYDSPSAAGFSIVKQGCNGWRFWYLKDDNNNIMPLVELRKA